VSRKKSRGLTPEDRELWDRVARQANPMHPKKPVPSVPEIFEPKSIQPKPISPFRVGEKRTATAVPPIPKPQAPQVRMDAKAFGNLKRGKLKPEARIDLHGMTVARAHGVLTTFIQDASARGLRLVLVITGKGKDRDDGGPIPTPRGVLRHNVPQWLGLPPLSLLVLQVQQSHIRHGGEGAFYVYLKRRK